MPDNHPQRRGPPLRRERHERSERTAILIADIVKAHVAKHGGEAIAEALQALAYNAGSLIHAIEAAGMGDAALDFAAMVRDGIEIARESNAQKGPANFHPGTGGRQ